MAGSVFVFGASGHAKVVIDIFERMNGVKVAFVIDDTEEKHGRMICGYPILGGRDALLASRRKARTGIVAIGDNDGRARVAAWLAECRLCAAGAGPPAAATAPGGAN